ncbi:hypothetical protein FRC00_006805 [Tulasnella sp. 408]|nr:hypothetical protein FRC00_006805 [Tulasnella sp. 408]
MGLLHAAYGLGAFAAPLVSTQFAQMKRWSFHYLISMGVALASLALAVGVFKLKRQDDLIPVNESAEKFALKTTYKQIFTQKLVITLAFFILVYVGIEVSIGGWIVTFLIRRRGGGPSTGYVSSGFFGGLMVGRVILLPVNQKLGKQRVIYIYTAFVIAYVFPYYHGPINVLKVHVHKFRLQFTVWFVPSLIQNAIAVSFVGLFLGSVYPVSINVAAGLLPAWLLAGAIGFIAAFGQAGSALFPFMTGGFSETFPVAQLSALTEFWVAGAIASKYGVQVLQPIRSPAPARAKSNDNDLKLRLWLDGDFPQHPTEQPPSSRKHPSMDDIKFEGKGGKEAEDFVAAVKKIALKQGKHQDSEWTAAFASSCFCGTALRWFEDLDETVQSDWKLLRRAILQQWPAEARTSGRFATTPSLPTSAAAPPPATVRTATAPAVPTKALSVGHQSLSDVFPNLTYQRLQPFKCLHCKAQNRPVDEEFCSARCQDDASRAAPLLIKLEATDPIYKEVNALFGFGWQNPGKPCPSVKRIFKVIMKPTLMEYYNAYRRAVEEQGNFTSKNLKPGNEKRIWAGVRRSCSIGDDWDFGGGRLCNKANCELCKILQDSFEVPKTGLEWLPWVHILLMRLIWSCYSRNNCIIKAPGPPTILIKAQSRRLLGEWFL